LENNLRIQKHFLEYQFFGTIQVLIPNFFTNFDQLEKAMKFTVFVYGTLQTMMRANFLLETSEFLGECQTQNKYYLSCHENGIPPFLYENEESSVIHGEAYEINEETLNNLDELEGHPNRYYRKEIEILLDDKSIVTCWCYFHPKKNSIHLSEGNYKKYFMERFPIGHEFYNIKSREKEEK
jgi:gamma-glutamylaminecyclotransferase